MFAIYQIVFSWKTYTFDYETDELPNPRPTQPKKNQVKRGIWAAFFHSIFFFVDWDWFYIGNRLQETQPNQFFRKKNVFCDDDIMGICYSVVTLFCDDVFLWFCVLLLCDHVIL